MRLAQVLLPWPLEEAFDYVLPEGLEAGPGTHVCAPLGPRLSHGVVLGVREAHGVNRPLKAVEGLLDEPPVPERTLEFVQWAARYSADSPGMALAIALRGLRAPKPKPERRLEPTGQAPSKSTPARMKVLEASVKPMAAVLADSVSGRELIEAGYPEDVRIAAELDVSDCAPLLADGAYRSAA